jgi:hypothetical protein
LSTSTPQTTPFEPTIFAAGIAKKTKTAGQIYEHIADLNPSLGKNHFRVLPRLPFGFVTVCVMHRITT